MTMAGWMVAGFLAMGPQWSPLDIPYPEVEAADATEARIFATLAGYARSRAAELRRDHVLGLTIEGPRAVARLAIANRTETVHLRLLGDQWRVTKVE